MKIIINGNEWIADSEETPVDGHKYHLIDAEEYTQSQRNTLELLIDEWFKSGIWDYDTIDKRKFREFVKRDYGQGFDRLKYVDDKYKIIEVKTQDEIPEYVVLDFANGNKGRIQGVIKSTTSYTKKQLSNIIDNVINAMIDAGVDTKKFHDILKELNSEKIY
jgi:hypothetical protein